MRVDLHEVTPVGTGWQVAGCEPGKHPDPSGLDAADWLPARVPGTVAAALRAAGRPEGDLDGRDWWFRTRLNVRPAAAGEEVLLRLGGIATVAEVWLDGERVLESDSMFATHAVDVGAALPRGGGELAIRCRALAPLLAGRRSPRARWRTRLVREGNLRFFRTMLLGRAPGFAPGPPAVGPWREVAIERRREVAVDGLRMRTRMEGDDGVLSVRADLRALRDGRVAGATVELDGPSGTHRAALRPGPGDAWAAELAAAGVARWWPHTHGEPALHDVRLLVEGPHSTVTVRAGRVGFRELTFAGAPERDGLGLCVNGVPVFARGAVWTPVDPVGLAPTDAALRAALEQARDAGMNMLRIPGTSAYESDAFHDLCDELGLLVWQDLMFANLDYPIADEAFRATVQREAREQLARIAGRPSLAVICGNSEIEQQVAMLGLDPALGRGELFGELLPRLVGESGADAVYVPSAPCGGTLPFRPDRGIANYYGVGGYRRPLEDVRRAGVRFAAECLAFANVPDEAAVDALAPEAPADVAVHHPRWKAGVPRDVGTGWDFDDVRDHYLATVFGVDPGELRRYDHARYLELSRAVTGEVMAEVFGEWRRAASTCGGGLVLWLRDLAPGAGWGVIDHRGEPKAAYHHLRRALAPVAVWTTDEGLNGIRAHVANDRPAPLSARLRVTLLRDGERRVDEAVEPLELAPHATVERDLEALLGRFADAAWAYRFGPPAQDAIVVALERDGADGEVELLSQAVRFPAGRPLATVSADALGLQAAAEPLAGGAVRLRLRSRRLAYGVRIACEDHVPGDDALCVEPGRERTVLLAPRAQGAAFTGAVLTAINLDGRVRAAMAEQGP